MIVTYDLLRKTSTIAINRRNLLHILGAASFATAGAVAMASVGDAATTAATVAPSSARFSNADWLVTSRWLAEHLNDSTVRISALTPRDAFEGGHIPGALQVDWPDLD